MNLVSYRGASLETTMYGSKSGSHETYVYNELNPSPFWKFLKIR